jgi:hypothetical protein
MSLSLSLSKHSKEDLITMDIRNLYFFKTNKS